MTKPVPPIPPPPYRSVTPHLTVAGAPAAIDFYKRAFGATEKMRLEDPRLGGKIACAELVIGDTLISVADEDLTWNARGPKLLGGTPVVLALHVEHVDAAAERALAAGAKIIYPVQDQFYGERSCRIEDPFGHQWILSTQIEEVSVEEMKTRLVKWWEEQDKAKA